MPSSSLTLPTLPTCCGHRSRHDHLCLPTHRAGAGLQWSLDHLRRAQHCASCVGSAHKGLENRTVDLNLEMGLEKEKAYLPKCQVSEGRRGSAVEAAGLPGRMAPTGAHTAGRHPVGTLNPTLPVTAHTTCSLIAAASVTLPRWGRSFHLMQK